MSSRIICGGRSRRSTYRFVDWYPFSWGPTRQGNWSPTRGTRKNKSRAQTDVFEDGRSISFSHRSHYCVALAFARDTSSANKTSHTCTTCGVVTRTRYASSDACARVANTTCSHAVDSSQRDKPSERTGLRLILVAVGMDDYTRAAAMFTTLTLPYVNDTIYRKQAARSARREELEITMEEEPRATDSSTARAAILP